MTKSTQGQSATQDPQDLSYEEARAELAAVVDALESGGISLEESLALWERGEALAARCQTWLDSAKAKLEAVRKSND